MNVVVAAMDRIYANPSMVATTVWISATTSEERPIRRAPDHITEFGPGRFVSDTMMRVSDLPAPVPAYCWISAQTASPFKASRCATAPP